MKELGVIGHCDRQGRLARAGLRGYWSDYTRHDPLSCTCCQDKIKHSLENNFGTTYSRGLLSEIEYAKQRAGPHEKSSPGGRVQRELLGGDW